MSSTTPSPSRFMLSAVLTGLQIDLFEQEAIRIENEAENTPNAGKVSWFLQGTLYPDVIESLSFKGPSATIKTHHNVGGLPKRMMDGQGLRLLEPLRELFKDECRALGRRLQIREDLVNRHPFPGPGIGVSVLGDITPERVEIARKADHIFISMIKEAGIYNDASFLASVARATANTANRCPKPMLVWIPTRVCVPEKRRLGYLSQLC